MLGNFWRHLWSAVGRTPGRRARPTTGRVPGGEWLELRQLLAVTPVAVGVDGHSSWSEAVQSGLVRPVDPFAGDRFTTVARKFYQQEGLPFGLTASQILADQVVELGGSQQTALVAAWRTDAALVGLSVGGWQYDYQDAPGDLTSSELRFSVAVPALAGKDAPTPALADLSIQLVDLDGNSRGWFVAEPALGWTDYVVQADASVVSQGLVMIDSPGFDITRIASIRLESSSLAATVPDPLEPGGTKRAWAAWNQLQVARPEGAMVHGLKFEDTNANGRRDAGETGLAGWTITLTGTTSQGLSVTRTATTRPDDPLTAADETGRYLFADLPEGEYRLVENVPTNTSWVQSAPLAGEYRLTLATNQLVGTRNFGNFRLATLQGTLWHDLNGDGLRNETDLGVPDWHVTYTGTSGIGVTAQAAVVTTSALDATPALEIGSYAMKSLVPGRYLVKPDLPLGWQVSTTKTVQEQLLKSGQNQSGIDFGLVLPARVSGRKFLDRDGNGQQEENEPGLAGWTMVLQGRDQRGNNVARTATTRLDDPQTPQDETGTYSFVNLWPGQYKVSDLQQVGWGTSLVDGGYSFSLSSAQAIEGQDFGNYVLGSMHGGAFHDLNGDGQRSALEPGLSGIEIVLQLPDGRLRSTTTRKDDPLTPSDETGSFSFFDLAPGAYQITERPPAGWVQPIPDTRYAVNVESGLVVRDLLFSNYEPGLLQGRVRLDLGQLGRGEEGEPGLADWKVVLSGVDGMGRAVERVAVSLRDLVATDFEESGLFRFDALAPGNYTLVVQTRPQWQVTLPLDATSKLVVSSGSTDRGIQFLVQSPVACDLTGDEQVDAADMGILFAFWGGPGFGDLNGDQVVDAADAGRCFAQWTGNAVSPTEPARDAD